MPPGMPGQVPLPPRMHAYHVGRRGERQGSLRHFWLDSNHRLKKVLGCSLLGFSQAGTSVAFSDFGVTVIQKNEDLALIN